jgi:hypothetical protein
VTLKFDHPPSLEAIGSFKGWEEVTRKVPILFLRSGHMSPPEANRATSPLPDSIAALCRLRVSLTEISSLLRCCIANPHWKPWTTSLVEASPVSFDGGAARRPVLHSRRLAIYSQSSISWPPVQIRLGIPLCLDWISALDQETNDHRLMSHIDRWTMPPWTWSTDRGPIPLIFQ